MDLTKTGKTIASLRKQAGYTQASLAERLGISDKAVSKWERGKACPDIDLWNKLSILLDTDIESLIYAHEGISEWHGVLVLDDTIDPLLTIYDKPLIHYLLSQFLLAGITHITVVGKCPQLHLEGIDLRVVTEFPEVNQQATFVIYGNYFIYGPNLTKHFKRAMSRIGETTVICSLKRKGAYPVGVDQEKRIKKTQTGINPYYLEPYAFFSECPACSTFEKLLKRNGLNGELMARGMAVFHVDDFNAAMDLAQFVRMMEGMTGEKIACLNEIMVRRGIVKYDANKADDYLKEIFD